MCPDGAPKEGAFSENALQRLFNGCTDCDICRFLMDESCLVFPEMYRRYDEALETRKTPDPDALRDLTDRCTLCGLCPCPDVRANMIRAKADRVRDEGLEPGARALSDIQTFARLGRRAPKLVNALFSTRMARRFLEKVFHVHPERLLPPLAAEDFFTWAARHGLNRKPALREGARRVAYFTGCTAAYLFPEVARAVSAVFGHAGVDLYVPPQECCGMPTVVEGDMPRSLRRIRANMAVLTSLADEGFDIVCSCPTCGYFLKVILKENACLTTGCVDAASQGGRSSQNYGASSLADDAFPTLDPGERIRLSEHVFDVGEYLARLHCEGRFRAALRPLSGRWVYYAPCHQREQGMGTPYVDMLQGIPGLDLQRVGSSTDCCGMGGSLGYKKAFHEASLQLGASLMEKMRKAAPEAIVTDCLSCRLQFRHVLDLPVYHPVEVLAAALGQVRP
ncbi:MAG: heterodisulfide reductase-related iron-sulfur binding cluster [Desulfosoma sp.]